LAFKVNSVVTFRVFNMMSYLQDLKTIYPPQSRCRLPFAAIYNVHQVHSCRPTFRTIFPGSSGFRLLFVVLDAVGNVEQHSSLGKNLIFGQSLYKPPVAAD
jgi:hypothetical protein